MVSTGPQETRCRVSAFNSFCGSKIVKPALTEGMVQFPDKLISIVLEGFTLHWKIDMTCRGVGPCNVSFVCSFCVIIVSAYRQQSRSIYTIDI